MGFAVGELDGWLIAIELEFFLDARGEFVIEKTICVFGPGGEAPIGEGDFAFGIGDEDGAGVASPDAIGGPVMEAELGKIDAVAGKDFFGFGFGGGIVDDDFNALAFGDEANDLSVDPRDGLEFSGPVFGVVRPGEPCGIMRSPLGRHAVAGFIWFFHLTPAFFLPYLDIPIGLP